MMEKGKSVSPGEFIGTEEEFAAGEGTFTDAKGNIYAAVFGSVSISKDKVASVKGACAVPKTLRKGSIVYGRVEEIFEPVALLSIQPTESGCERCSPVEGYSVLHASRVKRSYVEMIHDEMRIGDIVKAVVDEVRTSGEVMLSTKEPGLGVVKAFCSRCRAPLALKKGRLECERCGSVERRHLSNEYAIVR
jgi:exosome complex component CSL4